MAKDAPYRPERTILDLDERFRAAVEAADFPGHTLRWRNQRWAREVGLGDLSAEAWIDHFGRFRPLPGSLETPQALAYHGHQFGQYNPEIGDGRGFLFAQVRDREGRLLDLGTKGSGRTPWSRTGDGRLTLKGGVREILAASMLEALGVYTSKAFSVIETGEALYRGDEPSPTRSCVLVRLSHSHLRFGTFQRQAYLEDADAIACLVDYGVRHLHPEGAGPDTTTSALGLFRATVHATARLAASWMAAGFVHGVLNTDNMVVTGESFDYGPWRFLPASDPGFVAAYFDQTGLYRFGRQPQTAIWNLSQLGSCLTLVAPTPDLEAILGEFDGFYREAFRQRVLALLGLAPSADMDEDMGLIRDLFAWMTASKARWPQVFFDWFGGPLSEARAGRSPQAGLYADTAFIDLRRQILSRAPARGERMAHPYFARDTPASLLIEEVEALWDPIAAKDDWTPLQRHLEWMDEAREALDLRPSATSDDIAGWDRDRLPDADDLPPS
jgi:serine/tyrosine/threonine adenylyltransferase